MQLRDTSSSDPEHDSQSRELEPLLGNAIEEKPIWERLCESVRVLLFPEQPPPGVTSIPIPVKDLMAMRTNPWAVGTSTAVNGGLLALLLLFGFRVTGPPFRTPSSTAHINFGEFHLPVPPRSQAAHGGGGGGASDLLDPTRGRLPKFEASPMAPPQIPIISNPKLPIDSAAAVPLGIRLPDNLSFPNVGVHVSPNVTLDSNGPGAKAGIGTGEGSGDGPGVGRGYGPGYDAGAGNGIYTPGGDVSAPVPLATPDAEFSDEARRAKFQGVCMISLIVDTQGNPRNPRVVRHLGMGLDEKALEAVMRYKFKPAKRNGKPVPVLISIEVNFRLY